MKHIIVIGGGVSGMSAAITAAKAGADVTILEQKERVGKKILSTGNGRCNFTNLYQEKECYRSDNAEFPWAVIQKFDETKVISFFEQLGIYAKNRNGYLYPNSDQAAAVLDAFCMECRHQKIHIHTETKCLEIQPNFKGFRVKTSNGIQRADAVILAAGSKAAPVTGSDGSGYELAKKLGHHLVPVLPALVQLRCAESFYKQVAGVRIQAKVSLYGDGNCLAEDTGEVQLTNYGISGIPVFQVSRFAARALYEKKSVYAVLNFMPEQSSEELLDILRKRAQIRPEKTMAEFFVGLFHKKMAELWIKLSGISFQKKVGTLSEQEFQKLVSLIQNFRTEIKETNSFEQAQICCGGIDTREVNPDTLESKYIPKLFFAGEILDVDGICGGYNITFAVASGVIAGKGAVTC